MQGRKRPSKEISGIQIFSTRYDTYRLNNYMYRYQVYVKVKGSMVKTIIFADNDIHARLLAQYQYGINNVSIPPQRIGN